MRLLLVASTTGYQVREFSSAADSLGYELVLATDRCHVLPDPWADDAVPIDFRDPEPWFAGLARRGPFHGILAVGDVPARIAAHAAERFGLRYHPASAALAANNKLASRKHFHRAGLLTPAFRQLTLGDAPANGVRYPCVLKPLNFSGSRGVIRADSPGEFRRATERIARMVDAAPGSLLLAEDYIPGREFALEGVVSNGILATLALFDKPGPLEGPFFEETIYVTPSREPESIQLAVRQATQRAVTALGLSHGPIHAEMRVNAEGVWMLEVAARPIGGLCSRVLRFVKQYRTLPDLPITLEDVLLRHAAGQDVSEMRLMPGAHGVMMIPIPRGGVYRGVYGMERAARTPGVEEIVITAKEGQVLLPLPEGSSYLGFIFARAGATAGVEHALRAAHAALSFDLSETLLVVK